MAKTAAKEKKPLGERLTEAGVIDGIQLSVALGMQKQTGLKLGRQLLKLGFIDEETISKFMREDTDIGVSLIERKISAKTISIVPEELAFKFKVIPVAFDGKTIVVATADPKNLEMIDTLAFRLGKKVHPIVALEWDIESALLKYYKGFSDDELSMLTSKSAVADQYEGMQWSFNDEVELDGSHASSPPSGDDFESMLELDETMFGELADAITHIEEQTGHLEKPASKSPDKMQITRPGDEFDIEPPSSSDNTASLERTVVMQNDGSPFNTPPTAPAQQKPPQQAKPEIPARPMPQPGAAPAKPPAPAQAAPSKPAPAAQRPQPAAPQAKPASAVQKPAPAAAAPAAAQAKGEDVNKQNKSTLLHAAIELMLEKKLFTEKELIDKMLKIDKSLWEE